VAFLGFPNTEMMRLCCTISPAHDVDFKIHSKFAKYYIISYTYWHTTVSVQHTCNTQLLLFSCTWTV
jgi:hypothetical protein